MQQTKQVLITHAHYKYEGISEGRLNKTLAELTEKFFLEKSYTVVHSRLQDGYNIEEEIEKIINADLIIVHTPVFSFNAPWIYKKYAEEIFLHGMISQKLASGDGRTRKDPSKQFGTGGHLQGKKVAVAATWNAPAESFCDDSQYLMAGLSADDVLSGIVLNYKLCGMEVLPFFHCYDVVKNPQIEHYIQEFKQYLQTIDI